VRKGDFWKSELFAKDALTEILINQPVVIVPALRTLHLQQR
jgi:hypothetical protein